ncbi:MAG: SRPBCC family protein [Egibacteraceae bacterium]
MALIDTTTHIEAPPERVWAVLADWEGQPTWMADARSVAVLSPHREGVGVVLRCRTGIVAGLAVTDDMTVTEWDPPRVMGVRHLGAVIRGVGAFELSPTPHGTRLRWWEEFTAPLGTVGEAVAQTVVVPLVERVFRRSLAGLKRVCEAASIRP